MRFRKPATVAVAAILLLLIGWPTAAQQASDRQPESEPASVVSVEEDHDGEPRRHEFFGKVTVTATKTDVDPELSPVTTYSVDATDIEVQPDHYMDNFGEYVRDLPGVHVAQYYPWGPPWVHLRGTGHFLQRTAYLIDGVPVHAFMSAAINPEDIARVDVVLGPASALYGASAAGGAVNIITRNGAESDGATVRLSYGSNATFRPRVAVGDRSGSFDYYFSYSGDDSDGYQMRPIDGMVELANLGRPQFVRTASVEDNDYDFTWLTGKVGWGNDAGTRLDLAVSYQERYLYGGQPSSIINDNGDTVVSSLRLTTPLGGWGKLTATVGYHVQSLPSQDNGGARLVEGEVVVDDTIAVRTEWDRERIPFELQADLNLGPNNVLTTGLYAAREIEDQDKFRGLTTEQTYRYDLTTDMSAAYLQDQVFLMDGRLSLLAGLRFDRWEYSDIYDAGSSNPEPASVSKDAVTYRGGIKLRLSDSVSLRSSAGTAYWPGNPVWFFQNLNVGPTWRVANPDLDPEETWMVDAGVDLDLGGHDTFIGATAYYGVIDNIMAYTYEAHPTEPNTTVVMTRNIGEAEIYGLELGLEQPLTRRLALSSSLTLNHSRITEDKVNPDNVGNQLRNAPDYWGSVGLRYLDNDLLSWEVLLRFSDDRYYDDENVDLPYYHMEAYETLDVKAWRTWDVGTDWELLTSLSAVNLLDEEYATEIVYVNPGRYVQATLGLRHRY
jgi:iron complex outermembrane receptor protein